MSLPEISRRRVLAASAWTPPAVIVAGAAPAYATSGTVTARVAYLLDWGTSGYDATTNAYAIARPIDATTGAPDLVLAVTTRNTSPLGGGAVWHSAGGDDLTITPGAAVGGLRALTLSSETASAKVGTNQLYQTHRFLELTPQGFSMRNVSVRIGGLSHACSGHGVFRADSTHANSDAIVFSQGASILAKTLPMTTTSTSVLWAAEGAFGNFAPTTRGEAEATFTARDAGPLAGTLGDVAQPLNIAAFNRCEGWSVSSGNEWRDHTPTTVFVGAVSFLADVEVPGA